jgi:hypothetical protein
MIQDPKEQVIPFGFEEVLACAQRVIARVKASEIPAGGWNP